jgi:hypothetical protein
VRKSGKSFWKRFGLCPVGGPAQLHSSDRPNQRTVGWTFFIVAGYWCKSNIDFFRTKVAPWRINHQIGSVSNCGQFNVPHVLSRNIFLANHFTARTTSGPKFTTHTVAHWLLLIFPQLPPHRHRTDDVLECVLRVRWGDSWTSLWRMRPSQLF